MELANTSGDDVRLGGYGLWNAASSNYANGGSREDRAAYLFPPDQRILAGRKLRVYFGAVPTPHPPMPAGTTAIGTGQRHYIGAKA